MRNCFILIAAIFVLATTVSATTPVQPTTTLARETGNNTSASSTFKTQSNGNIAPGNVSKMPISSLLYAGNRTKIYVHLMPWFGTTSHMNVGYESADAAQVARQVADMQSRGIQGAIVDWYGPNSTHHNQATIYLRDEAARRGNFQFAITEDVGALKKCAATVGCDLSQQVISDLTYAYKTFEQSPAYMREAGRPVVFFFGMDAYSLDWSRIRANTPGNPLFIFRNSGAFSKIYGDGGFGWVGISSDSTSMGLGYLDNFYATSLRYPNEWTYGSGYKGFNDTLASWGKNRIVNQQCGQTWLKTMAEAGKYYSASNQLNALQIVTWNDYEEGTEIETGIDNCVSVSASMSGTTLNWSITGQESTIDHYTVFISLDGQNLMPVDDVAAGTNTLDMSGYAFGPDAYTLYVKAVGKATLLNQMSAAVSWNVLISNKPPVAKLSVTPTSGIDSVTANATTAGSSDPDGSIASYHIDFGDGTVAKTASASHKYSTPGSYTVTATVTDNRGAQDTATASVTVIANQPPQARVSVSPATGIAPVVVSASATASTDADGTIASTQIAWGDGSTTNAASGTHTYSTPGAYTVTATVTDDLGETSKTSATVNIAGNQAPAAKLALSPTAGNAPVTVTASTSGSTDVDGSIASSIINWGDGTSSAGPSASHTYSTAGTYAVRGTVTDNLGATSSASGTVTVSAAGENKPPVAKLSLTPARGIAPVTVTASTSGSYDPDGSIASTTINWGDGSSTAAATASHIYRVPGTYTVTATVTDRKGASARATSTITVFGVKILTPTSNAIVGSPARVAATATGNVAITAMKIYVDYVAVYSVRANKLDTYIGLTKGTHRVVVQAWDMAGTVYKSTVFVTVK
ncbi:MAG TPA: PKD domain-containing protein [Clostridia bacterium]|nr:PKD domain-containing protein [Clostridia bacterium]